MKKAWFRTELRGMEAAPATWEGWLTVIVLLAIFVSALIFEYNAVGSFFDAIFRLLPLIIMIYATFTFIVYRTTPETPKWLPVGIRNTTTYLGLMVIMAVILFFIT